MIAVERRENVRCIKVFHTVNCKYEQITINHLDKVKIEENLNFNEN